MHKLLLNSQVVISDCQHSDPVFELLRIVHTLQKLLSAVAARRATLFLGFLLLVQVGGWRQMVHQKGGLHDDDGLVSVSHGLVMLGKLGQNSADVQVSVGL